MSEELCYLTATEALRRFRERSLSPVELTAALIDRAGRVDPGLGAFTFRHFEEAMDAARRAEARYGRETARRRPLEGLAVAIKDSSPLRGRPTSQGSFASDDTPAERSSPVNDRVLRAGAICHARTATPEFSAAVVTHSPRWGVTRNPWNPGLTPGGSSGGTGAALAAGTTTLATGSDIGGSIRVPASCCGVVGYKPPYGRNPGSPPFNLDPFCHTGPMARSVGDAILLQNVMCGPHPEDIATLRPRMRLPAEYEPIRGWRIAYSLDLGHYPLDPAVRENTLEALAVFRDLGATTVEVDIGWGPETEAAARAHLAHVFGASMAPALASGREISGYVRAFAEVGSASPPQALLGAMEAAAALYARAAPVLERHDLFLCPTTALPAVTAAHDPAGPPLPVGGTMVDAALGWVMTPIFNMLSRCPVLAVPSGRAPNGVPTGIQLVGRTFRDTDVFRAGLAYETATGGWFAGPGTRPAIGDAS